MGAITVHRLKSAKNPPFGVQEVQNFLIKIRRYEQIAIMFFEVKMKIFLMFSLLAALLCSCIKVQKKSEFEVAPVDEVQVQEVKRAPVVYRLNGVLYLTQDTEIRADEIYLEADSKIYTNQFSLKINSSIFYSDRGAVIQSFADQNMMAPVEQSGLNGGVVEIKTDIAKGNLQVRMNGQSGGPGRGGWTEYTPSDLFFEGFRRVACKPNSGKNAGRSGSFFVETNDSLDFYVSATMEIAHGGLIGPVYEKAGYIFTEPDYQTRFKSHNEGCLIEPHAGEAGSAGQICMKLKVEDSPRCERY